ncbi:uncharacterized protein GGS22DRAFT_42368 [Annulohypoxylon maeteangense]|uniref:uncharacterized protein n=1 Tax=Annulohypoxylon maeteangense TaxID=1927788 RepID=UPI0020082FD4|nr:uncharacterized protein GGS22DRAFT_42368 [Annulohypoxylon maeteangense]KAI0882920.1 hypothetical protein GGS22DRAFT_42368 [Annulohypoxylon maeteangense]
MKFTNSLLAFASSLSLTSATPLLSPRAANQSLPAKTIFQFNETGTWFENLSVRPNGDLVLTTLTPSAQVWTLKAPYSANPQIGLVHTFQDGKPGLVGIAETKPDVFVVIAAEFAGAGNAVPGTFAIYEIAFKGNDVTTRKVIDFPEAKLANGVATVPRCGNTSVVLIGDSFAGSLWRLDTGTGKYESVLAVAEMTAPAGGALPIGINGLKVHAGFVYWGNSATATIYRARIDKKGYPVANATVEVVAALNSNFVDDFAFDAQGMLWAATNGDNKVDIIRPDGAFETVVGGATLDTVGGDSAVAFGRTSADRNTVYVSTSGVLPGNRTEPAKIVAINRAGFR